MGNLFSEKCFFSNKIVKYIRILNIRIYRKFFQIQLMFFLFACGSPGSERVLGGKLAGAGG